jgi:phage tail sheath protein FI
MPTEFSFPGVFVEEISSGAKAIEGVPTSTAALAGWAPMGPTDRAEWVRSWKDYEQIFGGLDPRSLLGYAVRHFFANGGKDAWIVCVADANTDTILQPNTSDFESALLPANGAGGLYHLDHIEIFNLLCVPGETNQVVLKELQHFCRERRAFLIADCPETATFATLRNGIQDLKGADSRNSALYFPWINADDGVGVVRSFPPSGFVAGIYARTDMARGVWKSAAGTSATVNGAVSIAQLSEQQAGLLNTNAVNCIRAFPGRGIVVWGARTLDGSDMSASEWKYVPVRRLTLYIEESLVRGLQWVVFEPNDEPLWTRIRSAVDTFMFSLFREGALQGQTPREAYFVKCDRSTTSQNDIDNGIVNIVVGFAPLKPAEFVIIKLQQMTAKSTSSNNEGVMATKPVTNAERYDPYKGFKFRVHPRLRRPTRHELGLSEDGHAGLDKIVEHVRRHELLGDVGKVDGTALFGGPSGTGKTLAAEVIADELGLELYRVDMSRIVSKYIGETEKHLSRIFAAADAANAVLFFDEADALLGKRSEVKDSHDRYANIEVAYLMQRIEEYKGLTILATNRKRDLDEAFLRRIRFVVDFP